jgi:hypothetical protein
LINYTFTSPIDDGSIIVELTGPANFDDTVVGNFIPFIAIQFTIPGNGFSSTGTDINGRHGYAVVCNENIAIGQQLFFRLSLPRSSTPQNFGLRVRAEPDASLNNGRIVSEETCCLGAEVVAGKQYYLDIPTGETSATIFVERDPNRPLSNADLLVNFGSCVDQTNPTHTFPLTSGMTAITIDQNVSPPLQEGRYYITMPRPATFISSLVDLPEFYTMGACLGAGCTLDLPPPGSSGINNTGTVILPGIAMFIAFIFSLFQ